MSQVSSSSVGSNPLVPLVAAAAAGSMKVADSQGLSKFEKPSEPAPKRQRKSDMNSDIEEMMYGFGDSWPPNTDCVDLIESLVTRYIEDLAQRAKEISDLRGKMDKECFLYVVRKDRSKFSRVCQLLKANEELKNAQKTELKEA